MANVAKTVFYQIEIVFKAFAVQVLLVAVPAYRGAFILHKIHYFFDIGQLLCSVSMYLEPNLLSHIQCKPAQLIEGFANLLQRFFLRNAFVKLVWLNLYTRAAYVLAQL